MSHGPHHYKSINWQGKACGSVCRITINITCPEQNPFLDSTSRAADASKKRNLMAVGGQADNDVDLCEEDNVDTKRSVKLFQRGRERLPGCVVRTDAPVYMCCECCTFCCLLLMDKARAKDKIYI